MIVVVGVTDVVVDAVDVVGAADVVVDAADVVAASSCLRLVGAVGMVVCMSTPVWSLVVVC